MTITIRYDKHMQSLTTDILAGLQAISRPSTPEELAFVQKYLGAGRTFTHVRSADRDRLIRAFLPRLKPLPGRESLTVLEELVNSPTFDALAFAGKTLSLLPPARQTLTLPRLKGWLAGTQGWAECDCLCQSLFSGEEVRARWEEWERHLPRFAIDRNIQIRRASLVLQVKPARTASDRRFRNLAFATVEQLKGERTVLITKAISWLLRSLAILDKDEVWQYLETNRESLPGIAYRETKAKILTGRKMPARPTS
jgi:3-methyladenine DNA glycosylase AlkD